MNNLETEVELLELLITAECKTKTAFAKLIGMSRQNINNVIRKAEKNEGKLNSEFKHKLKDHNLDLFKFKREPTNDFYPNQLPTTIAAQPEAKQMERKIIELLEEKIEMYEAILEANNLLPKKHSRRHSA